ncbi:MAG TPA: phosphatidate cytidylyltransferase [Pirellulales bacterium]
MLFWRLLLSAIFVPGMLALCWLDLHVSPRGVVLVPFGAVVCCLAVEELVGLFKAAHFHVNRWVIHIGCIALMFMSGLPHWMAARDLGPLGGWGPAAVAFAACVGWTFADAIRTYNKPEDALVRFALATAAIAYLGWLFSVMVHILWVGPENRTNAAYGITALASLLICVKMGDIGAYTVGRLIGRNRLAPLVSPGKTVEGLAGGLAFSVAGAWIAFALIAPLIIGMPFDFTPGRSWLMWGVYGVCICLAGILGDLSESMLKRSVGRKDSSTWMPGFGGVLDLIDSILMAAPAAYLFWSLGWIEL